jgi:hypothetical protein
VICVNPIVPFDAKLAAERGRGPQANLVEGGLPAVLSQTFRAVIHSRMATGLSKYRTQYRGADVLLFQPEPDDAEIFFTNVFSYASRQRVCEHAYMRTRRDLAKRSAELGPVLARHGIRLRHDLLADPRRRLDVSLGRRERKRGDLGAATADLADTLHDLRRWATLRGAPRGA